MGLLTRQDIINGLQRLGQLAAANGCTVRIMVVGGAAIVLGFNTLRREQIWQRLIPHLLPGHELKAQYAFDDLWESLHGDT